jgi:hypothetical protein
MAEFREPRALQNTIIATCFLINFFFFLIRSDYIVMFVAASFYLNMFYFLTLLVPTDTGAATLKKPEITRFLSWLKDHGITSGTRQFTRIFINTFFMNCRALTFAISLLFAVDILFTVTAWYAGRLPAQITLFVVLQSLIIICFYGLIGKVEPFTTEFADNISLVRDRLSRELPPLFISLLFFVGFLVVVFLFLTTIILLPGITLNAFLTESGLTELAYLFIPLTILAMSQYFIIRSIHGRMSLVMAGRLMDYREQSLKEIQKSAQEQLASAAATGARYRYEVSARILESRIYQVKRNSLLGTFPVWVVDLDFSVLLDTTTLTFIKGFIKKA